MRPCLALAILAVLLAAALPAVILILRGGPI